MLNALLNVIIAEGLHDRQYVQAHTEEFEKLREHVKAYTPEAMAKICGIDAGTLRTLARKYAHAVAAITFSGTGTSHHIHATGNPRSLIAHPLSPRHPPPPPTPPPPLPPPNTAPATP